MKPIIISLPIILISFFLISCISNTSDAPPSESPSLEVTTLISPTKTEPLSSTITPTLAPTKTPKPTLSFLEQTNPELLTPSQTPAGTLTPTPTPVPTLWTPFQPDTILSYQTFTDPENTQFHDLILFSSYSSVPIPNIIFQGGGYDRDGKPWYDANAQLWAFSPDGFRVGRLSEDWDPEHRFPIFYSTDTPPPYYYVEGYIHLNNELFQAIQLPEECLETRCGNFVLSPNGQYFAFFFGDDQCGRGIKVLNTQSNQEIYSQPDRGHWFRFLSNGKLLIASGHCEGGGVELFDPTSGIMYPVGGEGSLLESPNSKFLLLQAWNYLGSASGIVAYNLETNQVYAQDYGVIENLVWAPDGEHFLYSIAHSVASTDNTTTFGSVQIIKTDRDGSSEQLLSDTQYDFHLCGDILGCQWSGDWIVVRRFLSQIREINYDAYDNCLSYGIDCPDPVELFALNWQTGELIPLEQTPTASPTPISTPPVSGPDLSQISIYTSPSGNFAFYIGLDGRSLWYVPQNGEPVMWVEDGENFMYIP